MKEISDNNVRELMRTPEFFEQIKRLTLSNMDRDYLNYIENGYNTSTALDKLYRCGRGNVAVKLKRLVDKGYLTRVEKISERNTVQYVYSVVKFNEHSQV